MSSGKRVKAELPGRLRQLRASMSQVEFGRLVGIKQATYSSYERGQSEVRVSDLVEIAEATSTSLLWLLLGEGRQPAEPPVELTRPVEVRPPDAEAGMLPVNDRLLAEAIAALADEYEDLDSHGRDVLLIRFWHTYPELKQRSERGEGRRVAGLAGS